MRFIQIAVASDPENGETLLYALGDDGNVYERATAYYGVTSPYQGKTISKGYTYTPPFWRKVDLPFSEPPLKEEDIKKLKFEEEINP